MRTALITAGLFLLSYIAVNRGLGPNPLQLVVTVIVVLGFAVGVSWLVRRGRAGTGRTVQRDVEAELMRDMPTSLPPTSAPRPTRSQGARKLF